MHFKAPEGMYESLALIVFTCLQPSIISERVPYINNVWRFSGGVPEVGVLLK